ncbi:MAG: MBL fold metallo-hydrolase [Proteobacteria bacterium]|nr:MBL fold metallo-hydrolase [Pseudomonadota bacterium]
MEFSFLGTSAGTPTKDRNVSGMALRPGKGKSWFLIDCGEGTQHQLLKTPYSLFNLEVIFITHSHGDHCYGLPGLLAGMAMAGRTKQILLVAPKNLRDLIESLKKNTYLNLTFEISFIDVESLENGIEVEGYEITRYPLSHVVPSYAYRFDEQKLTRKLNTQKLLSDGILRGPVWGHLQKEEMVTLEDGRLLKPDDYLLPGPPPRCIIVSGDNDSPELLSDASAGAHVLIHESTWTQKVSEKVGNRPQHCSAKKIGSFAEKYQIPNLVLTHFSPRYANKPGKSTSISDIKTEALENYSGNLFLANDFDNFSLSVDKGLVKLPKKNRRKPN